MFLKCWSINSDLLGPGVSLHKRKYFNQVWVLLGGVQLPAAYPQWWTATGSGEWVPTLPGKNATAQTPRAALGHGVGRLASVWKLMGMLKICAAKPFFGSTWENSINSHHLSDWPSPYISHQSSKLCLCTHRPEAFRRFLGLRNCNHDWVEKNFCGLFPRRNAL